VADRTLTAYCRLLGAQVRSQSQYRASFAADVVGSLLFGVIDVASVVVVFRVTPTLGGFGFAEVFLMTALAGCAFATADLAVGNVERLRQYVRSGLLDSLLVRPLSALAQLAVMDVATRRVGRVAFGVAMIVVAVAHASVPLTAARLALLVVTPIAGAMIFGAVFVASATVAFWWIESGEIANGLTYGGLSFTQYPITIYGTLFRRLFAYAVGFAFVAYYPTLTLLERADPLGAPAILGYASPAVAIAVVTAAGLTWRAGVRHYRSTGS
jgi:viologen exporter family transport system permease protein